MSGVHMALGKAKKENRELRALLDEALARLGERPDSERVPEDDREEFLLAMWTSVRYWKEQARSGSATWPDALEGLAFSLLVMLDGESGGTGGFEVRRRVLNGDGEQVAVGPDVSAGLHGGFYGMRNAG